MENYKRLDFSKIKKRPFRVISTEESLANVIPFLKEAYDGTKKVVIDNNGVHYINDVK